MNAKHCENCGKAVGPEAKFCSGCGAPIGGGVRKAAAQPTGSTGTRDLMILIGVVAIVILGYFLLRETPDDHQKAASAGAPPNHEESAQVLANLPDDYGTLVQIGNQFMDQQNFPLAAEIYRRALAIDGSSPNLRTDFGACLHSMGLDDRALIEFRQVVTDHPDHAISRFNMGIVFNGIGQPDSAAYYWRKFVEMAPDSPMAEAAQNFLNQLKL
jgi:tetratricopeptide (TPR) repeat protein